MYLFPENLSFPLLCCANCPMAHWPHYRHWEQETNIAFRIAAMLQHTLFFQSHSHLIFPSSSLLTVCLAGVSFVRAKTLKHHRRDRRWNGNNLATHWLPNRGGTTDKRQRRTKEETTERFECGALFCCWWKNIATKMSIFELKRWHIFLVSGQRVAGWPRHSTLSSFFFLDPGVTRHYKAQCISVC